MPRTAAIEAINKAIWQESEITTPPFHIFNDQGRVLFSRTKGYGDEIEEDLSVPLCGFVMYHKLGTEWPSDTHFDFPTPPGVSIQGENYGATGFEIPANASQDFDWKPVVLAAIQRLKEALPVN